LLLGPQGPVPIDRFIQDLDYLFAGQNRHLGAVGGVGNSSAGGGSADGRLLRLRRICRPGM
jgi:hypothetical protein